MSTNRCPHCGLILTAKEAHGRNCPSCGLGLDHHAERAVSNTSASGVFRINAAMREARAKAERERPPLRPVWRVIRVVGGALLLIACAGLLTMTIITVDQYRRTADWPTAIATVKSAEKITLIGKTDRGRTTVSYLPKIEFTFEVDGKSFSSVGRRYGTEWTYGSGGMSEAETDRILADHSTGKQIKIQYNPVDPNEAIRERFLSSWTYLAMALSAITCFIGLRLILSALRGKPAGELNPMSSCFNRLDKIAMGVGIFAFVATLLLAIVNG